MDGETYGRSDEVSVADVIFDVLSHTERRRSLRYLVDRGPVVGVDELAIHLATQEADGEPTEEAVALKQTVLVHTHLPRLAAAGLVRWTAGDDDVRLRSLLNELSVTTPATGTILDMTVSHSPPGR